MRAGRPRTDKHLLANRVERLIGSYEQRSISEGWRSSDWLFAHFVGGDDFKVASGFDYGACSIFRAEVNVSICVYRAGAMLKRMGTLEVNLLTRSQFDALQLAIVVK